MILQQGISQINSADNYNTVKNKTNKKSDITEIQQEKDFAKTPQGEVWQAVCGISPENSVKKANRLINKFALMGKLGVRDIYNLKKIIKGGSEQAENVSMLLSLVNEKQVNPRTLKYVCKDGLMTDEMEKDIKMIFNAQKNGINPDDAYIPNYISEQEALNNAHVGDLFELDGQKNVYIKNKDGKAEQLKMDKNMMLKLFPPAERFANAQNNSSDCYFISTVNSMIDSPEARAHFLQCFEQNGNDISVRFPSNNYSYTFENAEMPKTHKKDFLTGSAGMKLAEYAYGKFLEDNATNQALSVQNDLIKNLQQKISATNDEKEIKTLNQQLKAHELVLEKIQNAIQGKDKDILVELDDIRKPVVNDSDGVSLRSLNQMNTYRQTNYQTAGDYYRGDGGYMEDVFKDFGYEETNAYSMEDKEIQDILLNSELSKNYIFSGGTKREGKQNFLRRELVMDRSLNMYGAHAYRLIPSKDADGNPVFKVSNPWNSSHNSVLTIEQLKEFFTEIHTAKIQ